MIAVLATVTQFGVSCARGEPPSRPQAPATVGVPTPAGSMSPPRACDQRDLDTCPEYASHGAADVIVHPRFGQVVRNEVLIEFSGHAAIADIDLVLQQIAASIVGFDSGTQMYQVRLNGETTPARLTATVDTLRRDARVTAAGPHTIYGAATTAPSTDVAWCEGTTADDCAWGEAPPGGRNWALEAIRALSAWDISRGDDALAVGVVDFGFDEHEDLVIASAEGTSGEPSSFHGTHVAGILGAAGDNGRGVTGVAWQAALHLRTTDGSFAVTRHFFRSLVRDYGARVVNFSGSREWKDGSGEWKSAEPSFGDAALLADLDWEAHSWARLIQTLPGEFLIVQSAGNDGVDVLWSYGPNSTRWWTDDTPFEERSLREAASERVLSVGGIDREGRLFADVDVGSRTIDSNHGRTIDVAAPGVDIFSTLPRVAGTAAYGFASGTSQAAPLASGVAVLLWSKYRSLTAAEGKRAIVAGARARAPTRREGIDYYLLDAYQALLQADEIACRKRAELCNGYDDNCNGVADEAWPLLGQACFVGVGACEREGTWVCAEDGMDAVCDAVPGTPAMAEVCINGEDDDCNGEADENCACDPIREASTSCGTDVGLCEFGEQACRADGTWGPCDGGVGPTAEACNGEDDDCDGTADEDWLPEAGGDLGTACTAGTGPCERAGSVVCTADGVGTECDAVPGEAADEVCNGDDDDCDGVPDDGDLCVTPPASACLDATTLQVYEGIGACSDSGCVYGSTESLCQFGCDAGACVGDPCAGVLCDSPPAAVCTDAATLRTFAPSGICIGGSCEYLPDEASCPFGCAAGACLGLLRSVFSAGGTGDDSPTSVTMLSDGSIAAVGTFTGTATFGLGMPGETTIVEACASYAAFVARYQPGGDLIWVDQITCPSSSFNYPMPGAVGVLSDDSIVLGGDYSNSITFAPGLATEFTLSGGSGSTFLARYDGGGRFLWAESRGAAGSYGNDLGGLGVTASDAVILGRTSPCGWTGTRQMALSRETADGADEWSRMSSCMVAATQAVTDLFVPRDGSVTVVGNFNGTATFGAGEPAETSLVSAGASDMWVARFDTSGLLVWARQAGGSGTDQADCVASDSAGKTYVAGRFSGEAVFGPGEPGETVLLASGTTNFFVAGYDAVGTLLWARRADEAVCQAMALPVDGGVALVGWFTNVATLGPGEAGETTLVAASTMDEALLARFEPDGSLRWARRAGGIGQDWASDLVVMSDGDLFVVGGFHGTATFAPGDSSETTVTASGTGTDGFFARYAP